MASYLSSELSSEVKRLVQEKEDETVSLIVHGQVEVTEQQDGSMVEKLRTQFVKDKLRQMLFRQQVRYGTMTKGDYVRDACLMDVELKAQGDQ